MTDEVFKISMDTIENEIIPDCPCFIEKQINKSEKIINCVFRFQETNRFHIDIDYVETEHLFYMDLSIFSQTVKMCELSKIENVYLLIKSELIKQIKTIPSYRLQLLYEEENIMEDFAEDMIRLYKKGAG